MPLPSRQGLRFDGLTAYLQLPSMTMDAIEIDCFIHKNQISGSPCVFDARTAELPTGFLYLSYSSVPIDLSLITVDNVQISNPFLHITKGKILAIHTKLRSASTRDFINVFANQAGLNKIVGEIYSITCYLNGSIVAQYNLDEGFGTTAYDSSGNGNHGTIVGATWIQKRPVRTLSVPMKPKKNWFGYELDSVGHNGNNTVTNDGRVITVTSDGAGMSRFVRSIKYSVKPYTDYTLSFIGTNVSGSDKPRISPRKGSNLATLAFIEGTGFLNVTFNTGSEREILLYLYGNIVDESVQTKQYSDIQLELGTTASSWEPYELVPDLKPAR